MFTVGRSARTTCADASGHRGKKREKLPHDVTRTTKKRHTRPFLSQVVPPVCPFSLSRGLHSVVYKSAAPQCRRRISCIQEPGIARILAMGQAPRMGCAGAYIRRSVAYEVNLKQEQRNPLLRQVLQVCACFVMPSGASFSCRQVAPATSCRCICVYNGALQA